MYTDADEVRHGHVPLWFKKKMVWWLRLHDLPVPQSTYQVLRAFAHETGWHVDHEGSSRHGEAFVNEPYGGEKDIRKGEEIALMLNCEFWYFKESHWGHGTIRMEFRRKRNGHDWTSP